MPLIKFIQDNIPDLSGVFHIIIFGGVDVDDFISSLFMVVRATVNENCEWSISLVMKHMVTL